MMKKTLSWAALAVLATFSLAACSSNLPQSGATEQSGTTQSAPSDAAPTVDRSGEGNFPAVTGGFGEKPTISAGEGEAPAVVSAKTLVEGDGKVVGENDFVLVNYAGVLWDGTPFDSSFERGEPIAFSLNGVIPGWKYGLAEQKVGDRVELVIPAQWGYGEQGTQNIPGGSTLVFVVDILQSVDPVDNSAVKDAKPVDAQLPAGVTVEGALGEEPTVTYAKADTPAAEGFTVLAEGKGAAITDKDYVVYQVKGALQGSDTPPPATWEQAQILQPGAAPLAGKTVGSRLLYINPGNEQQLASAAVIDVLAVMSLP
ncbi:FKBP-type peptidyl-prolyl cis-trans isomerase [Schaalia sp. Marseille-Q2122]|uniref:FKBP-type peptidyl-prolyl cis-trans isomerase n=1 Tax=Schaalia sp. Marseille-Q2122 TaxID=2736604 RepID=UPI0015890D9F|nr:FKBP-type peptidyl-prolyl cis-trans isomerase [Schaalia sp. Marseille-Q2122]